MFRILTVCAVATLSIVGPSSHAAAQSGNFDIAPFARRCCASDRHTSQLEFDLDEARNAGTAAEAGAGGRYIYGLQWTEERDISEIRFHHARDLGTFEVQYWFRNWPYEPPHMPSIEDPVDDPWNGEWLTATTKRDCGSGECSVTFLPLTASENSRAKNLPGVNYRRTIKLRLVFHSDPGIDRGLSPSNCAFSWVLERVLVMCGTGMCEFTTAAWRRLPCGRAAKATRHPSRAFE